ncbi:hypothetical protein H4S08_003386 [Coemansia sp. RSA 1365]|nr:hypothetical protein H4S08_003386 [Coemansia sp. RSA 1365]
MVSRETCASSSSPCSSPITPGIDPLQPDPMLADLSNQSATLNNIGAWSTVQPMPSAPSLAATGLQTHGMPPDMIDLDKKYSRLAVAHGLQPQINESSETNVACSNYSGADVDYSELDEAILRGRSTTLPNIFAMRNSLNRFSTADGDEAAMSASATPVSTSAFGMFPRHGSLSIANKSHRTVSPLGLSLSAIPIHQTTSLDRQITTQRDLGNRFDMFGAPVGLGKPSAGLSGSSSSNSNLINAGNASVAPVRRFSEHMLTDPSMPSLGLTPYSMGSGAFPSGGTGVSHSNSAGEGSIVSGVTHEASVSAINPGHNASATRVSTGGILSSTRVDGSLYQKTSAAARYGVFGSNLPTMREEDASAELLAPSLPSSTLLMRNSSFPSASSPTAAMPQPLGAGSGSSLFSLKDDMPRSPTHEVGSSAAEPQGSSMTSAQPKEENGFNNSAYHPPRVQSLKDMRRPSLDMYAEPSGNLTAQTQAAAAAFERAAGFKQSMAFGQMPGITSLHRRHSLASTNAHIAAPVSGVMPLAAGPAGDYPSAYPTSLNSGIVPQHPHMAAATVYSFGTHPGSSALPRQNSLSALSSAVTQQQPQQYHPFYQASCATSASTHALGEGAANGGLPRQAEVPHIAHFMGHMVHSSQSQQPHSAFALPPVLAPAHIQPISLSLSAQQGNQPHGLQQHARRASLPGINRMGTPAVSMALAPPMPELASSSLHQPPHPMLPNPATTFRPNMPFADMGKGITYQSLPRGTRVFVVQFKGKRCDLFFAPGQGMELKAVPALTLSATAASAPARGPASGVCTAPSAVSVPTSAAAREAAASFEPGIYVLVEADRGVDLGIIKEELTSAAAILSFSAALSDATSTNGCSDLSLDGRRSTAPSDSNDHRAVSSSKSSLSSKTQGHSTTESVRNSSSSVAARDVYIKRIFRAADQREVADLLNNKVVDEKNALNMCQSKVQQRKLAMRVYDAEFQFDRRKLTFYFTADHRINFNELVRDLFKHFKTRIWMCWETG